MKSRHKSNGENWSIVATDRFVQAMRDSGYSSTASAISELVDNAIQASARSIRIDIALNSSGAIDVAVQDDGCGMDPFTLRQALRFGGSSRFNDRSGLGRFGMGLPNSSFSQARRLTVTSWSVSTASTGNGRRVFGKGDPLQCCIDLDEIASGDLAEVPVPKKSPIPIGALRSQSGTIVRWEKCDRLDHKRAATIARHVSRELSQRFRHYLNEGTRIYINDERLGPVDPMFVLARSRDERAEPYGKPIIYEVSTDPSDPFASTGFVQVRFFELPVSKLAGLSNDDKRRIGVLNGAGVSIVRAGREVDFGWFFFGKKRRENYDDWWRCEVRFDPILDEAFGLTHTKQRVRPQQYLVDILAPDLEQTARILNGRVRRAHGGLRSDADEAPSAKIAATRDKFLQPMTRSRRRGSRGSGLAYRVEVSPVAGDCFYAFRLQGKLFVLTLDPDHSFFREIYVPLRESARIDTTRQRDLIELLLISAARAEAGAQQEFAQILEAFRVDWSKTAETLIGG